MKSITLAVALLALAGCKDYGRCLASHQETVMVPQYMTDCSSQGICTTRLAYFLPSDDTVCDQWEFPDGRPKK